MTVVLAAIAILALSNAASWVAIWRLKQRLDEADREKWLRRLDRPLKIVPHFVVGR